MANIHDGPCKCEFCSGDPAACGLLLCVDTWLGTTTAWLHPDQQGNTLYRRAGFPSVYYQFLHNVAAAGLDDIIVPLPLPSTMGALYVLPFTTVPKFFF